VLDVLEHGSDGLVLCGTTGEASTLTDNSSLGLRYHSKVNAPSGSTPMVGVGSSVGIASAKRRA